MTNYEDELKSESPLAYFKLSEDGKVSETEEVSGAVGYTKPEEKPKYAEGGIIKIPEGAKITWISTDKPIYYSYVSSPNYAHTYLNGKSISAGDTLTVTYEMNQNTEAYKILTGQKSKPTMPAVSKEFVDFFYRFAYSFVNIYYPTGTAGDDLMSAKASDVFPWPGWWDLILSFDQSMRLLTGSETGTDLYSRFRTFANDGGMTFYPTQKISATHGGSFKAHLLDIRKEFRKATAETCAMCGHETKGFADKDTWKTYEWAKHFSVYAVAVCGPCKTAGIVYP